MEIYRVYSNELKEWHVGELVINSINQWFLNSKEVSYMIKDEDIMDLSIDRTDVNGYNLYINDIVLINNTNCVIVSHNDEFYYIEESNLLEEFTEEGLKSLTGISIKSTKRTSHNLDFLVFKGAHPTYERKFKSYI